MEEANICHDARAQLPPNALQPRQESCECSNKQTDIESDVDDLSLLLLDALSVASDVSESTEQNEQMKVVHNGTTRIYCVCDSKNAFGSCTGFVAIKSLADEFPDEELVTHLTNEYDISKLLSHCSAIRAALAEKRMDGIQTIVLDWINGTTLQDWIYLNHKKGSSSSLTTRSNHRAAIHE
eukprot:9482412-Ditylum_brightwellii.AAC.1